MVTDWGEQPGQGAKDDGPTTLAALALERVGALTAGGVEALKARPLAGAAAVAVGFGLALVLWYGRRRKQPRSLRRRLRRAVEAPVGRAGRAARRARHRGGRHVIAGEVAELLPLAMKLLANPLVRGALVSAVTKAVARRVKA